MGKKHHPEPNGTVELERLLGEMQSADEATRARAARQVCPCRIGWERFEQAMDAVGKLRKDPSPEVRRNALHVFEDAFEMDNEGLPTSPRAITNEMDAARRRHRWANGDDEEERLERREHDAREQSRRQDRQRKRETTATFARRR